MTHGADRDADTSGSTKEAKESPVARSFLYRVQKYGYQRFPAFIPDPERHEHLRRYRRYDADDNTKTEPPLDEVVDSHCVWAVEFYTPSQISNLLRGFESLGWNTDDSLGFDRNPTRWVQDARKLPHGGAWFNLGLIHRSDAGIHFGVDRKAPLPSGVKYALARMYSLTSSITCIAIGFVLEEPYMKNFERALRRKRETYIVPLQVPGHTIVNASSQKENDVRTLREEMRGLVTRWFRLYLPGLFASGILAGEYPTCEFLTLRKAVPFPRHSAPDHSGCDWLRILDIYNDLHAWRANGLRGLTFNWPLLGNISPPFHAVIVAREKDISDEMKRLYGVSDRGSLVNCIDQFVNGLLTRWALAGLLAGFERYLNNLRDTAVRPNDKAKTLRLLEALANHISRSVDISAVSVELKNFAAHEQGGFNHGVNGFSPCNTAWRANGKIVLVEMIRQQIVDRAEWLRNVDRSVRDILVQYGTTLGTRENIKLQKRMTFLTWVIVVLTILTATLAGVTAAMSVKAGNLSWPW